MFEAFPVQLSTWQGQSTSAAALGYSLEAGLATGKKRGSGEDFRGRWMTFLQIFTGKKWSSVGVFSLQISMKNGVRLVLS